MQGYTVTGWIIRIVKSMFALPVWVIVWINLFLVPANFSGFLFLDATSGIAIAALGAGAILINLVLVWLNGGLSKVLCIPHLILWVPLVLLLGYRLAYVPMDSAEFYLAAIVCAINVISLVFDFFDLFDWHSGNRAVAGYPDDPVRF